MNTQPLLWIAIGLSGALGFAVPAALPEMLAAAAPEVYEYATPAGPSDDLDAAAATAANMFFQ